MNELCRPAALVATLILLLAAANAAAAENASDPRGVVVEDVRNDRPAFMVRVGVDRPDHVYRGGDEMHVRVDTERDGYLYLLYCDAEGNMTSLFPNHVEQDNRIKAGVAVEIPGPGAPFRLRIAPPYGREVLKAIVSLSPLEPKQVKSLVAGSGTAEKVDGVKAVYVEMKNQPAVWAEHYVSTTTLPPAGGAVPPGAGPSAAVPAGGTTQPAVPPDGGAMPHVSGKRVGVFIGISDFRDPAIRDLKVGYKDAVVMADAMRRFGRLDEMAVLIDKQATLGNIEQAVRRWLPAVTQPGDTAILFWSGHGARCADDNGDEKDGYDEYLVPYDGQLGDIDTIRKSMLLDDTFGRWVQELDGRRLAIILDTCHSGGQSAQEKSLGKGLDVGPAVGGAAFDFLDGELQRAKDIGQQDTILLASSQAAQVSFERREGDLSVMTYFFVAALSSANRPLTIAEIYDEIRPRVAEYVEKAFPGTTQTPVLINNLLGPLYIRP